MWCDDFDGDLYKLVPEARSVIAPAATIRMYTTGHTSDGQLNHPACWSADGGKHVCFFGFEAKAPQPPSHWSDAPLVPCTFEEVMRDLWCHQMEGRVLVRGAYKVLLRGHVPPGYYPDEGDGSGDVWVLSQCFDDLLYAARWWKTLSDDQIATRRRRVLAILDRAVRRIQQLATEHGAADNDASGRKLMRSNRS